ncbi:MAG: MFS transporter [Rhodospirillales bacterium]|jgi:predicted MFS family arabinose efflux permease|nr:MFS transporter [Rhodospirillales bacterium]
MTETNPPKLSAVIAIRVFLPFAMGYFLSYAFRVVNAVIAPDLTAALALDAADLGLLTSTYFITFATFQLPLGMLLDRYGPRRVESALLLLAVAGAALFSVAGNTSTLIVGRGLIGLGASACLMASFKAFVLWFPHERLPLVNGCIMAAGGLGALAATAPVEGTLAFLDWRGLFAALAVATLAASATILLVVPERKDAAAAGPGLAEQIKGVGEIFRSGLFWRMAPLTVASQSSFLAIQGLWTGPWLADVGGLARESVAQSLLTVAAAMTVGFLVIGVFTDRVSRLGIKPINVAAGGMFAFMVAEALIIASFAAGGLLLPVWIAFGFFGTTGIISYAALSQRFPAVLAGRLNTGLNLLVFVGASLFQWGIGVVINLWPAGADGAYPVIAYQVAFGMVLVLQLGGLGWFLISPVLVRSVRIGP